MDGHEASRIIRDPHSSVLDHAVPIIALTAHSMTEDRNRCAEAGMNGYLSKPLKAQELLAAVERYSAENAGMRPSPGKDETCAAASRESVRSSESGVRSPAMEIIRNELLTRYAGDSALVEELLELFREEMPVLLRKVGDALEGRNARLLEMQAHACKSAAGAVGFNALLESARQIEQAAKEGDFEAARSSYERLVDETRTALN